MIQQQWRRALHKWTPQESDPGETLNAETANLEEMYVLQLVTSSIIKEANCMYLLIMSNVFVKFCSEALVQNCEEDTIADVAAVPDEQALLDAEIDALEKAAFDDGDLDDNLLVEDDDLL